MEGLANQMQEMANGMRAMALAQQQTQEMCQKLDERQTRLEQAMAQASSQPSIEGGPVKRTRLELEYKADPQSDEEQIAEQPITKKDAHAMTVELINKAISTVVGPQVQQLVDTVRTKVNTLEQDIHSLKLRIAWAERDVMFLQTEVAKRQIVLRNWPRDSTVESRWATVKKMLDGAGIWHSTVTLTTPVYDPVPPEFPERHLAPISILTLHSFEDRQKVFRYAGKFTAYVIKEGDDPTDDAKQIKLIPGITQMERRLEAPLQHMMNAYTACFRAYKGVSFKPKWKTLTLTDDKDAWMGRVKYQRKSAGYSTASPQANWICKIQLPQEMGDRVLESWKETWTQQLQKQVHMTDAEEQAAQATLSTEEKRHWTKALSKPRPEWNEGEDMGVPQWKARYAWEFPWQVEFEMLEQDHPERKAYTDLRTVDDLMKEMSADAQLLTAANEAWSGYRPSTASGSGTTPTEMEVEARPAQASGSAASGSAA